MLQLIDEARFRKINEKKTTQGYSEFQLKKNV